MEIMGVSLVASAPGRHHSKDHLQRQNPQGRVFQARPPQMGGPESILHFVWAHGLGVFSFEKVFGISTAIKESFVQHVFIEPLLCTGCQGYSG